MYATMSLHAASILKLANNLDLYSPTLVADLRPRISQLPIDLSSKQRQAFDIIYLGRRVPANEEF